MKRSLLILTVIISAFIGAALGIIFTIRYIDVINPSYTSIQEKQKTTFVNYPGDSAVRVQRAFHFGDAAKMITPAVVHIRTIYGSGEFSLNPLKQYLNPPARSSGSGVILTDDGYIVTNNHVIEDATQIEVVMNNNQRFYAKLIGKDPSTDLALLKIKARNLPFVKYGDSDLITPGEWVLAIGNPFDLNSTVTAGIISAKARNIGILRDRNNLQVESFIQTDAAVNPGNSGGALVNLKGELIGINSAIATSTGNYAGYSFAIPVSLVKKIVDDLLEFGTVQRGLLGVQIIDVSAELAENRSLDVVQGVYITRVNQNSAAEEAGIISGDVIVAIDNHAVNSVSELQEWVARNRPGKSITVTFIRDGETKSVLTTLKNFEGGDEVEEPKIEYELEGATFEDISYRNLTKLNIDGGVLIKHLSEGKWKKAGIKEGFIITHIDKVPVDDVEDLNRTLNFKSGGILVEGIYQKNDKEVFGLDW
ncbi:MAG TPA: trypsin-like peptidase domain-containing protein [Cyclobacteriaceae bacterium]|nr:trypsin-like peptidase domain-containing protein [Cyclobacteriaceae bacterium]HRK54383.1 trypsin-like peptidase domain-containing protein [Cyclobacteriaceae bacterium]